MTVSGIEHPSIYVVATDDEVLSTTSDDYVAGVPPLRLLDDLLPGQRVDLVHLESRREDGRIKLTDLACAERATR